MSDDIAILARLIFEQRVQRPTVICMSDLSQRPIVGGTLKYVQITLDAVPVKNPIYADAVHGIVHCYDDPPQSSEDGETVAVHVRRGAVRFAWPSEIENAWHTRPHQRANEMR